MASNMNFCEKCNILTDDARCPVCGNKKLRDADGEDFCYFKSLSSFDFEMLAFTLQENKIEVVGVPYYLGGVTHSTAGRAEGRKVYVRYKDIEKAKEIYESILGSEE
ncbi:MAG: hypothetical protein ACI4MS_04790 [Candidatus Coproplasma sp.]